MAQTKVFILTPQDGRGLYTARSEQVLAEYSNSLTLCNNLLLQNGAWTVRYGDAAGSLMSVANNKIIWGGHVFNSIDSTSAAATPYTVLLMLAGGAKDGTGTATLYRGDTNAAVTINGVNFTVTAPFEFFALNIKNRCFVAARTVGSASVVPTIITKYPSASSYAWGRAAIPTDLTYEAFTNATNTNTKLYFTANGAGVTSGSTNVTKAAGANWDTNWAGKTVYLDGVKYGIVSVTGTGGPMTIDRNYEAGTATVNIRVQYGELSWGDTGPQYAVAKYNPVTGHITNIGPTMSVSEEDMGNVRVCLTIPVDNDPEYTRIVIFRTGLADGGSLVPLQLDPSHGGTATIDNTPGSNGRYMVTNNASGTKTYFDFQPDTKLAQIIGNFSGPTTNNPPPADIKYMAFWDGRVWVVSVSTPYRLQYSGSPSQIPLGVAEECFPALNFKDLTADDGFFTGLRVVGASLLAGSERYLFVVDGSSEATYRLTRISSRGAGVDFWAMDEHPGDSTEQSASAIYLSRDKRLWRQYPGGRIEDIGAPIQDKLDLINTNQLRPVVVRVVQVRKSWLLFVGIRITPPGATERYSYLVYDFDHQTWHDFGYGLGLFDDDSNYGSGAASAWGSVFGGIYYVNAVAGIPFALIGGDGSDQAYSIMGAEVAEDSHNFATQWLDFGDKGAKKSLQYVNVHAPADGLTGVYVNLDGDPALLQLSRVPDTTAADSPRFAGTDLHRFVMSSDLGHNQFHTVKIHVFIDSSVMEPGDSVRKLEVGYNVEQTGISGGSN